MGKGLVHEGRYSASVPVTFQQNGSTRIVEKGRTRKNCDRPSYDQDSREKAETFGANSGVQNE